MKFQETLARLLKFAVRKLTIWIRTEHKFNKTLNQAKLNAGELVCVSN
jgi:hypothetical protein